MKIYKVIEKNIYADGKSIDIDVQVFTKESLAKECLKKLAKEDKKYFDDIEDYSIYQDGESYTRKVENNEFNNGYEIWIEEDTLREEKIKDKSDEYEIDTK